VRLWLLSSLPTTTDCVCPARVVDLREWLLATGGLMAMSESESSTNEQQSWAPLSAKRIGLKPSTGWTGVFMSRWS